MSGARRVLGRAMLVLGFLAPSGAEATPPEAEQGYVEGNRLYRDGRFDEAAEAYRRILDLGVTAPEVEYNLGNAQLKAGRVGEAILHYRRALRMDPGHQNAGVNIDYARSLTQDVRPAIAGGGLAGWIGTLRLGPELAAVGLMMAWTVFWVLAWFWRFRWRGRTGAVLAQVAAGGLVLLLAAALVFEWNQLEGVTEAVILAEEIEVRTGPGDEETVSFRLHEGTEVTVLRESPGWVEIHVSEELRGWAPESSLARI